MLWRIIIPITLLLLVNSRRIKIKLGCLLCALSSSCSSLALADLHFFQLKLWISNTIHKLRIIIFWRRISMIQVIIHESSLQTIKINVCGFRPNGADYLNELKVLLIGKLICNIWVGCCYSVLVPLMSFLYAKVKLVWFEVVAMKENDGFGCWVVYFNNSWCLHMKVFTYLIDFFSFKTRFSRWNFFCCVILLYR